MNYTHGKNGSPDVEYGDAGLSSRYMISEAESDIKAKMLQAHVEGEAKREGKVIGRRIRMAILKDQG
tara:strand:+ start:1651 stop:1851 length:201 start_codon:yes stop_codon:yes gene_type:complete